MKISWVSAIRVSVLWMKKQKEKMEEVVGAPGAKALPSSHCHPGQEHCSRNRKRCYTIYTLVLWSAGNTRLTSNLVLQQRHLPLHL